VTQPDAIELVRLYVDQAWQGAGIGRALLSAAFDAARAMGGQALWLGVWERNERAIAFYRRHGFERVGEHTFTLGTDRQLDHVMVRRIPGDARP
jgi:ribosomal protein S18 acetylase RimI-like enzyme